MQPAVLAFFPANGVTPRRTALLCAVTENCNPGCLAGRFMVVYGMVLEACACLGPVDYFVDGFLFSDTKHGGGGLTAWNLPR